MNREYKTHTHSTMLSPELSGISVPNKHVHTNTNNMQQNQYHRYNHSSPYSSGNVYMNNRSSPAINSSGQLNLNPVFQTASSFTSPQKYPSQQLNPTSNNGNVQTYGHNHKSLRNLTSVQSYPQYHNQRAMSQGKLNMGLGPPSAQQSNTNLQSVSPSPLKRPPSISRRSHTDGALVQVGSYNDSYARPASSSTTPGNVASKFPNPFEGNVEKMSDLTISTVNESPCLPQNPFESPKNSNTPNSTYLMTFSPERNPEEDRCDSSQEEGRQPASPERNLGNRPRRAPMSPPAASFRSKSSALSDSRKKQASSSGKEDIILRSCEINPTMHQVEIPSVDQFLMHAKICQVMESYDQFVEEKKGTENVFNFADLSGLTRRELEALHFKAVSKSSKVQNKTVPSAPTTDILSSPTTSAVPLKPSFMAASSDINGGAEVNMIDLTESGSITSTVTSSSASTAQTTTTNSGRGKSSGRSRRPPNPQILKQLLDCAEDLEVEGYFQANICEENDREQNEATQNKSDSHAKSKFYSKGLKDKNDNSGNHVEPEGKQIQVSIFSSQKYRQFVVCYRGSLEEQRKPVRKRSTNKRIRKDKGIKNELSVNLHENHPVSVHSGFHKSYYSHGMEDKVFSVLNHLAEQNPFCDIVFTGHSYGGALSLLACTRYAALFPMMTVSCHAFGTPKVGGIAFRHLANSLPNLKVMRVEHGNDPYVNMPSENKGIVGSSNGLGRKWIHIGHTIRIESIYSFLHNGKGTSPSLIISVDKGESTSPQGASTTSTSTKDKQTEVVPQVNTDSTHGATGDRSSSPSPDGAKTAASVPIQHIPQGQRRLVMAYRFDERKMGGLSNGLNNEKSSIFLPSFSSPFKSNSAKNNSSNTSGSVMDNIRDNGIQSLMMSPNTVKKKGKRDHELSSYVTALKCFTSTLTTVSEKEQTGHLPWVRTFIGHEGNGVSGQNNEARCVV